MPARPAKPSEPEPPQPNLPQPDLAQPGTQPNLPQSDLAQPHTQSTLPDPTLPEPAPPAREIGEPDADPSQPHPTQPNTSRPHLSRQRVALAFGAALRKARAGRHLSQEKLAAKGHFDRTYPSLLERGLRTPTLTVVFALAEALEVHPLELVTETVARLQDDEATPPGLTTSRAGTGSDQCSS